MIPCSTLTVYLSSPDVDIKYIGGADPEMVLLDNEYNEIEVKLVAVL